MTTRSGQGLLFSVVVPSFNRPEQLRVCLETLSAQTLSPSLFEVVVVDDGSEEPISDIVDAFADRLQIKLLRQANGGCASARQLGTELAQGQYLAFTDDDCRPAADWLVRLEIALQRDAGMGVAGSTVNAAPDLYAEATQSIVKTLMTAGKDEPENVPYAPTSNVAFPRAEYALVGGLDRSWRIAGGEDRDLCARWRQAGFRLRHDASAKVFHYHHLNLRGYLRQHFHYGRGAWHYYSGAAASRFESPAIYPKLMAAPFADLPAIRALAVSGLVLVAQIATAVGFLAEAIRPGPGVQPRRKPAGSQQFRSSASESRKTRELVP